MQENLGNTGVIQRVGNVSKSCISPSDHLKTFAVNESEVRSYCREFPAVITTALGSKLTDMDGNKYIDFFSGAGALNYGHNHPFMKNALLEYIQSERIVHSLDFYTESKSEFISSFKQHILEPRELNYKFQFTGPTGTNSVEAALKLARKITGRTNIIAFTNAFHGMSLGSLAATTNPSKRKGSGISLNNVTFMPYEGYFGQEVDAFNVLKNMLSLGSGVDKPAAILLETIQGEGGLSYISKEWAKKICTFAKEQDILLIVDDIQAGCGRSGTFFSFETLGINPDIVCLSKSLSGYGLPMAMNLIKPEIDVWEPGEHNGTFRGNNLSFITAKATIDKFWADSSFQIKLQSKIKVLDEQLNMLVKQFDLKIPGISKKGRGLMRGLFFPDAGVANRVSERAFENGLIVETCGVDSKVLKFLPALNINQQDLLDGINILKRSLEEIIMNENKEQ